MGCLFGKCGVDPQWHEGAQAVLGKGGVTYYGLRLGREKRDGWVDHRGLPGRPIFAFYPRLLRKSRQEPEETSL
jgi:hypothetical protein